MFDIQTKNLVRQKFIKYQIHILQIKKLSVLMLVQSMQTYKKTTLKTAKFAANYESDVTKNFNFPSIFHFQKLK